MMGLSVILISVALAIALSVPSGSEFRAKAQAGICRANMRRIETAIDDFYSADGKYPPAGRLDNGHPLITDQYLDIPLECPTTHHYYIIEPGNPKPTLRCDSDLPGHRI
jgi:type II secretory pathway pseudopilin PulG